MSRAAHWVPTGGGEDKVRAPSPDTPRDHCRQLMREAIAGHLEVMREHGDPIPVPSAINAFTVVAA